MAVLLLSVLSVSAFSNPIIFDFEDPAEDARWQLNVAADDAVGERLENRWCYSTAEQFTGKRALIISDKYADAVPTATYKNTASDMTAVAKTILTLPKGKYNLSFAWKCVGESGSDGLYLLWEPEEYGMYSSASMSGGMPEWVQRTIYVPDQSRPLCSKSSWQTESVEIKSDGNPMQLAFVWVNNGVTNVPVSACVDFIQIAKKEECTEPYDVGASSTLAGRTSVTWKGVADEYQLMYRKMKDTSAPTVIEGITTRSHTVEIDEYGMYDFFVRGICGADTSVWVPYRNHLIYSPGCIDYANLKNKNNVECSHNVRDELIDEGRGDNNYPKIDESIWKPGVVDYGQESIESRHTVHTISEKDPRTGYGLSTIPDDEVVSVRLGNWKFGAEGERIVYTITADSLYRIILLKYAVVFQDPDHGTLDQPYFSLKILNEDGELLSGICGSEDFRPSTNLDEKDGWHVEITKFDDGTKDVVRWKDWTTVGVIIPEEEFGKKLKIRLQTYDCEHGGHYGYAYFTLSCAPATITGIACGEQSRQTISAPPGFTYKWSLEDPRTTPADEVHPFSFDGTISVDGKDTRTRYCECGFVTTNVDKQDNCSFVLEANLTPRFPKAAAILQSKPLDCETNTVKFNNVSTVVSDDDVPIGGEQCDSYEWKILGVDADSVYIPVDKNPTVTFPREGGRYEVQLKAGMSNGGCVDSVIVPLVVPSLYPRKTWVDTTVCNKYPFRWNGNTYKSERDTLIIDSITYGGMVAGVCDSTIYLRLSMVEAVKDTVFDTICQGEGREFYGQTYTTSGEYKMVVPAEKKSDCEATHYLMLEVIDSLSVLVQPQTEICAGDSMFVFSLDVNQGEYVELKFDFDTLSEAAGFRDTVCTDTTAREIVMRLPAGVRPDWYGVDVRFATERCDTLVRKVPFCVLYYPDDVLSQKWNDVIAVLNAANNTEGYDFVAFNWYRNGAILADETRSYLYMGEGNSFDYGAADAYSAGLMRRGEEYYIRTCSFVPAESTDVSKYVAIGGVAAVGQRMELPSVGDEGMVTVRWWSVSGQLVGESRTEALTPSVTVPYQPGIYVMEVVSESGMRHVGKVIVRSE